MSIVATDYEVVKDTITSTDKSIEDLQAAAKALVEAIDRCSDWQGADADAYKTALRGFAEKLANCASWMYATGRQSIEHSKALVERSMESANEIRNFE